MTVEMGWITENDIAFRGTGAYFHMHGRLLDQDSKDIFWGLWLTEDQLHARRGTIINLASYIIETADTYLAPLYRLIWGES